MKTVGLRVLRYIAILIIPWWNHKSAASLWQVFEPIDRSTGQVNFLLLIICCVVLYTLLAEYQNELEICKDMEPMVLTRVKKRTEELLALLIKPAIKRTMLFCMMVTAFSVINLSGMSRLPELILALGLTIILWDLCALLLYLFGVGRKISLYLTIYHTACPDTYFATMGSRFTSFSPRLSSESLEVDCHQKSVDRILIATLWNETKKL